MNYASKLASLCEENAIKEVTSIDYQSPLHTLNTPDGEANIPNVHLPLRQCSMVRKKSSWIEDFVSLSA